MAPEARSAISQASCPERLTLQPSASGCRSCDVETRLVHLCSAAGEQITNFREQLYIRGNVARGHFLFFNLVDCLNCQKQRERDDDKICRYRQKLTIAEDCALLFRIDITGRCD